MQVAERGRSVFEPPGGCCAAAKEGDRGLSGVVLRYRWPEDKAGVSGALAALPAYQCERL